jgi:hypothetical protein
MRCLSLLLLLVSSLGYALESEQFTLPPSPLADLGPALESRVLEALAQAVNQANAKNRTDPEALTALVYKDLGPGLPESKIERFIKSVEIPGAETQYRPRVKDSIFRGVFAPIPFSAYMNSPTVQVHGTLLGVDKIGHFFQQGFDYWKIHRDEMEDGSTEPEALAAAVKFGVKSERTYFGYLMSGVYSNADLAANFAGLYFYLNVTRSVQVDGVELAPLLVREENAWAMNVEAGSFSLKHYFTEHLSEAFNPSIYKFNRGKIRRAVQARCARWRETYPEMTQAGESERIRRLSLWFGQDYGRSLPEKKAVSLASECFN